MTNKLKIGRYITTIAVIFWIVENCYFGWNLTAMTFAEKVCDIIVSCIFTSGVVIYLIPAVELYEKYFRQ